MWNSGNQAASSGSSRRGALVASWLASTWRLVQSLNPDRILERGYARITARPGGETLSSAEAARAADTLTLRFRDGTVDVAVDQGGLERPAPKTYDKPKREPKADPSQPSQPTLL